MTTLTKGDAFRASVLTAVFVISHTRWSRGGAAQPADQSYGITGNPLNRAASPEALQAREARTGFEPVEGSAPRRRAVSVQPELPPNIKLGQLRRTVGLLPSDEWRGLDESERAAVDALRLHIWARSRQTEHPALEEGDCIFLTVGWVQTLLRNYGARKTGEKTAAAAISFLEERGLIVDTGKTKKPRRACRLDCAGREISEAGRDAHEGGKETQPSLHRSYWWRVFRVPALTRVRTQSEPLGAYAHVEDVPQHLASLSAFLRRQGLISRPRRHSSPNRGSVQWAFLHSGPP